MTRPAISWSWAFLLSAAGILILASGSKLLQISLLGFGQEQNSVFAFVRNRDLGLIAAASELLAAIYIILGRCETCKHLILCALAVNFALYHHFARLYAGGSCNCLGIIGHYISKQTLDSLTISLIAYFGIGGGSWLVVRSIFQNKEPTR
jgi:hypothetical protein